MKYWIVRAVKIASRKPLNIVEIAKLAGVTKSTVSRVVQNQAGVAPETRARVEHIIEVHHYRPSVFGRGLKGAKTGLIGVLGRWMESGFTAEVIRGIDDEVKKRGGHLLCTFAPGIDEYIDFWRSFAAGGQVDGAILIAPPLDIYDQSVQPGDKPVVLCASKPPSREKGWGVVGSLAVDNRKAMEKLVEHLAAKGYRRLVHLAGPPDILDGQERCQAFLDSVSKHRRVTGAVVQGAWTAILARSVVNEYLHNRRQLPDAFIAFNDAVALGTIEALKALRIAVPEEIAVTGWDDIPFSAFTGLSTVHLPMVEMGWEAARMLFRKLDGKTRPDDSENLILEMPLQIRQTT